MQLDIGPVRCSEVNIISLDVFEVMQVQVCCRYMHACGGDQVEGSAHG